jgi:hypothetical protein
MQSIYSYQKHINSITTKLIKLPEEAGQSIGTELATIDGLTYIVLPAEVSLPIDQPVEIAASIQGVTLTPELREMIKAASPHCQLINQRVIDRIRERYSVDDEAYFSRIGIGVALGIYEFEAGENAMLIEFGNYVEQCRQWGREQRAALGLGT